MRPPLPQGGGGSPSKDKLRSFRLLSVLTLYVGTNIRQRRHIVHTHTLGSRGDTSVINSANFATERGHVCIVTDRDRFRSQQTRRLSFAPSGPVINSACVGHNQYVLLQRTFIGEILCFHHLTWKPLHGCITALSRWA